MADAAWLPEHQLHVVLTLAHANALIERTGEILSDYLWPGPLRLANEADGEQAVVRVVSIAPLPAAVARCAADALTQLRSAVEHTLYAEVEHRLARPLAADEVRRIEMPAMTRPEALTDWLARRRAIAPLADGEELVERIRQLQPYREADPDRHPLRVLAEHTNHAKHRAPAVAAVGVPLVIPDGDTIQERLEALDEAKQVQTEPAMPGDVLARGPRDEVRGLDIWPAVSIRRPHTGTWHVLMNELGMLERWVRRTAVPTLVMGVGQVDELPARLDTTVGYEDLRAALPGASMVSGQEQSTRRMQARAARGDLIGLLVLSPNDPARPVIEEWVTLLLDDRVLEVVDRLQAVAATGDPLRVATVVRELRQEAATGARS